MILVDTNVISEAMRPMPDRNVVAWLDEQLAETLYVSAVSLSEILLGIALLPDGARKLQIDRAFREQEGTLFGNRILSFGEREARAYANVVSSARMAGHAISVSDGQIAATAVAAGLVIATRDRAPFEAAGLRVLDPWACSDKRYRDANRLERPDPL